MDRVAVTKERYPHYQGGGLQEYSLVIYPDAQLKERIINERQLFAERFEAPHGTVDIPYYITLATLSMRDGMEDTLVRWMQRICSMFHGFRVSLGNFNGTPAHSIFIQGQQLQPFYQLGLQLKTVDEYIRSSACPPVHIVQQPSLQFASNLSEETYRLAMPLYARQFFNAEFEAKEVVLLEHNHAFDNGKMVQVFRFLPAIHQPEPAAA